MSTGNTRHFLFTNTLDDVMKKLLTVSHAVAAPRGRGELGGLTSPQIQEFSKQKFSKKNGMKFVDHTVRLKNYVNIPPLISNFSVLAPPLFS